LPCTVERRLAHETPTLTLPRSTRGGEEGGASNQERGVDLESEVASNQVREGEQAGSSIAWTLLAMLVMGVGIAMRLWFYLYNRSMYRDEAALALNIVHRSFGGLLKPLDNDQGAPIGFLMIEKLVITLLGNHEWSLRLVPLSASILSLPLFYWLCRKVLTPGGAVMALVVLAMGAKQYDYSSDAKQYATDVLLTVFTLLLGTIAVGDWSRGMAPSKRGTIALGIVGALAIWFSHPVVFVLGGIAVLGAMEWLGGKPRGDPRPMLFVLAAWAASFAGNYLLVLHRLSQSTFMRSFWAEADAFAPAPKSIAALIWYKETFFQIFESPLSMGFVGLCALVFLVGVGILWRRRKSAALALLLPIVFTLAASGFGKYPFKERLILFICPMLAIFIGAGFEYLFQGQRRPVGIIALIFLLITPLNKTREYIRKPWLHSDMRQVMSLVAEHRQPGDQLYVYEYCYYPYEYYRDRFGLADLPAIRGKQKVDGVEGYKELLADMKGKRVWVMFEDAPDQQEWAGMVLDGMGRRVFEAKPFEEYVACYDLR